MIVREFGPQRTYGPCEVTERDLRDLISGEVIPRHHWIVCTTPAEASACHARGYNHVSLRPDLHPAGETVEDVTQSLPPWEP